MSEREAPSGQAHTHKQRKSRMNDPIKMFAATSVTTLARIPNITVIMARRIML